MNVLSLYQTKILKVSLINLFLAKSMVVTEMIILNFWYIIVIIVAKSADTWIKANNFFVDHLSVDCMLLSYGQGWVKNDFYSTFLNLTFLKEISKWTLKVIYLKFISQNYLLRTFLFAAWEVPVEVNAAAKYCKQLWSLRISMKGFCLILVLPKTDVFR